MLDVCLLGCSGMMPLPKRALTALMVRYSGSSLLVDCGEGTQVQIRKQGWSFHDIDTICITHFHGDHISGLPGLLLSMGNADRREPVTMIGPRGLKKVVNALMVIAQGVPFEIKFVELTEPEQSFEMKGFTLHAYKLDHNVTCYGYTMEIPRAGKFDMEKAKENQVPMAAWSPLQKKEEVTVNGVTYTRDQVLGPERKGLKLTYCTDTRPVESIVRYGMHSDLFICEGMYGDAGKLKNAKDKKHMTFEEAADLAKRAEVAEMWLTHYSPSLVRPDPYMKSVRKIFPETYPGKDLKSVTLKFKDDE